MTFIIKIKYPNIMSNRTSHRKATGSNAARIGVIGASIAGLAAAYFFLGPKGKKHQRQTRAWAIKMKGDIVEKLEGMQDVTESAYNKIVDSVATAYAKRKVAGREEISDLAGDIKKHWKTISAIARA